MTIRRARPADSARLYEICRRTGADGHDATDRYPHAELLGDIFLGAYLALQQELAFVVEDCDGVVGGYIVAALDSVSFAADCAREGWPRIRAKYRDEEFTASEGWLVDWITNPPPPPDFANDFPSHLHIDLLPTWQSDGWGRRLIERELVALADAGSHGVHLGVSTKNTRTLRFYRHLGLTELGTDGAAWLGKPLR